VQERQVSWVPSIVFGSGILLATALAVYAPQSYFVGLCATGLYSVSLGLAGSMDRRMGPAFNVPNMSLRKYRWVTTTLLLIAVGVAPGWLVGLVPGFGIEGMAQLRHSPRCATEQLKRLWRKLRG
jgi:hypothetical protein